MRPTLTRDHRLSLLRLVVVAAATMVFVESSSSLYAQESPAAARSDSSLPKSWEATAPGRVEPASQETSIAAPLVSRIAEVLVAPSDKVFRGELLVRLEDDEARARLAGAEAQVALRQRARNDDRKKGSAERRRADDAAADAERLVADARSRLDDAVAAARREARQPVEDAAVKAARSTLSRAHEQLRQQQAALRSLTALPSRSESELNLARADLTLAEAGLEKTRIRAPFDGTVLQVMAKVGEVVAPSPAPLILLGDVSALRVRAELDERDISKVRPGQGVVVRANAFKDRTFLGTVRSIAQYVGPGRMSSRGARNKLTDIDVLEVIVDVTDPGPLAVGMQVDVYFRADGPEPQGSR